MLAEKKSSGTLLTPDKHKIAFDHYRAGHSKLIIIAHGFYNSKDAVVLQRLAESLLDEYDVFMFDFRGHGKSSGLFTWISKEGQDLKTVLDHLDQKYAKTGILAFSMGGSIAINVLSKFPKADSLVCVSSPCEFEKIDYHFWELDWQGDFVYTLCTAEGKKGRGVRPGKFWLKKDKPIDNVAKLGIPVFYIHGEKDWVIKPRHSRSLYEKTASKRKLLIIKDGPHAEYLARDHFKQFITEVKAWFEETLSQEKK